MAHTALTKSEKATLAARRTGCYIALVLISFLCLFFFYVLVINSTRTHFEIQKGFSLLPGKSLMTNLKNVLNDANIPVLTGVRNSLIVSACSAALSVYFSALTAYGIYAYNFRFKKAAFAIILLIMTMPTQVSALGFLQLITKMGLKNSFLPLIIPSIAAPAVFFFMKQYLDASLPMEIVEAARIDGAGEFYTFNKIVLPIMKPALAVQAIFAFVSSWNNYFIPALVLDTADKKTLPILIAQLRSADFLKFDMGKVYMMVAIAILPVIMRLPDVVATEAEAISEEEHAALLAAVEAAAAHLDAFREQEGAILIADLLRRVELIEQYKTEVVPFEKARTETVKARILDNLSKLAVDVDRNRLEQEMIFYLEKLDITEEKVRLANHCRYFREVAAQEEGAGRKLGFIAQEMGREINTMGSKANESNIQILVVKMKDELEKIKEQVLNIL